MKISTFKKELLYSAIYTSLVDVRIKLKLSPKQDIILAQVENEIWDKQKKILGIKHIYDRP